MADNYLLTSTQLDFSEDPESAKKERAWAEAELKRIEKADEYESITPFKLEDTGVWFYSHDSADLEQVADFLQAYLHLFRPGGYHEFEWACTCSRPRLDEFYGGGCLVTATDQYWFRPDLEIGNKIKELGLDAQ